MPISSQIWYDVLKLDLLKISQHHTVDTTRIKPLSTYVCTERIFDSPPPFMCNRIFVKQLYVVEVGRSHLYASFGIYWVHIAQFFEGQWDFKLSEKFEIDDIFPQIQRFDHFPIFAKTHCVPWINDQFGRKRYQRKSNDVYYKILQYFFKNI